MLWVRGGEGGGEEEEEGAQCLVLASDCQHGSNKFHQHLHPRSRPPLYSTSLSPPPLVSRTTQAYVEVMPSGGHKGGRGGEALYERRQHSRQTRQQRQGTRRGGADDEPL